MSDVRIQAKVVIDEILGANLYRALLPNGKRILGFVKDGDAIPPLKPGDAYSVLLSPCNFDEGRLAPPDLKGIKLEQPVVQG